MSAERKPDPRARRRRLPMTLAVVVSSIACVGAADAHDGTSLTGKGTATIDGVVSPGEWDGAARIDFAARVPSNGGGGTAPGSLFVMNDDTNLYIALRVDRPGAPRGSFYVTFDNDHDGVFNEEGSDAFVANPGTAYFDDVWTGRPPCPVGTCGLLDTAVGGTNDGQSATGASDFVYEVSKPLDSLDDLDDISLKPGSTVGFGANIQVWSVVPACNFGSACVEDTLIVGSGDIGIAGKTVSQMLGDLTAATAGIGPGTSLADKAESATAAVSAGDVAGACDILAALDREVGSQGGKSISDTTATMLLAETAEIRTALEC